MPPRAVTPVTFALPTAPPGYSWEATTEAVAERYGLPLDRIARFDLNTSVAPPEVASRLLAAGPVDRPMSEYPPADHHRLARAAAARYGVAPEEVLVGAGADEVLDIIVKAFLPAGGGAALPVPTYAMYRVLSEQRQGEVIAVPRRPAAEGFALDVQALRAATMGSDGTAPASLVWLCSPNNPTGLPEPDGAIASLLDGLAADAAAAGRPGPIVVLDEAYAELAGTSLLHLREQYAGLVVIRTMSKVYALAGLRVGFALARPEVIEAMAPYRPPGSVSVVSVSIAADLLADDEVLASQRERIARERERLTAALADAGWRVYPSVTNFLLVDFGTPERCAAVAESLLRRGLVPRTFPAGHPLAHCLRLTVRDEAQDDRMIAAARELGA
jgi:histidinol-phosphate aminotransferase